MLAIKPLIFAVACSNSGQICLNTLPHPSNTQNGSLIQTAIQIAIGIIALLSVLFIVTGGMRYIFSQGDPGAVSKAKGTILYAIIGLIIAIFAQALVVFVIDRAV